MDAEVLYPHKDLTERIIGAAFDVHNELGAGFVEKVYENALAIELGKRGLKVEQQKPVRVQYQGESIGEFVADLIIDDTVLVEVKSAKSLTPENESKLIHYLKAIGIEIGFLINFDESVVVRRKIYNQAKGH